MSSTAARTKYYHTIIVPITSSCGEKQLLPLETRILQPKKSITCCASKYTKLRKLDRDPKQKYSSDTLLLTSSRIWKQGRFCKCNKTSLHFAIKQGWIDKVEELLNEGASLGAKDDFGKVPIQYIRNLTGYDSRRILDVIWLRIIEKPDVEVELLEATGLSLIHLACLRDDLWAVKQLLKKDKSSINLKTFKCCRRWPSYTPLHFAVIYGRKKLVHLLLQNKADPKKLDRYGNSPVHLAAHHGKYKTFHLLMDYHADPYGQTYRYLTPLRLALQTECPKTIEAVLEYTRKNVMDNTGSTPLHYCCEKKLYQTVRSFLGNGIDPDTAIHFFAAKMPGFTPLHVAIKCNNLDMVSLLLDNGAHVYEVNAYLQTAVDMVDLYVKDKRLKEEMNKILVPKLKDDVKNNDSKTTWLNTYHFHAYITAAPIIIEVKPKLKEKYSQVVDNILLTIIYKKFFKLKRNEMYRLFFEFDGANEIVKTTLLEDGTLQSKFAFKSYGYERYLKMEEPDYHYYVVNELTIGILLDFGIEMGNHKDEIEFIVENQIPFFGETHYLFLKNMEVRRLLGFGGRHQLFWKEKWEDDVIMHMFKNGSYYVENLSEAVSKEINSMKKLNLGPFAGSLFNVLQDERKLSLFLGQEPNFLKLIMSDEFAEKIPHSMGPVRWQFIKASDRSWLIKPAIEKLSEIIKDGFQVDWSYDCSDLVASYLNSDDMLNLIKS